MEMGFNNLLQNNICSAHHHTFTKESLHFQGRIEYAPIVGLFDIEMGFNNLLQ